MKKSVIIAAGCVGIIAIFWRQILGFGAILLLMLSVVLARPEVCEDISRYEELRSGPNAEEKYQNRLGLEESIWPEVITADMDVKDYKMVYYNPWDQQYLGYLVVDYPKEQYDEEVKRLKEYNSTEYKGYYGVTGEEDYNLLAVNADSYYGFIYAMTDDKNRIIYAEQVFCNYFMDLEYEEYMPEEYFLDGFNAKSDSPYTVEQRRRLEVLAVE
ncbi:MAG: hypothetical protein IKE52_06435 [Mogibacterium sp.]|nr:hypothetical protein [Mogibacterium sp.]